MKMMSKKLGRYFFNRPTLLVAQDILGKFIIRVYRGIRIIGLITESEAYIGPQDKASHAYLGKITPRNKAEYMNGGVIYIYLVYGMHWQFNISTRDKGLPECILIRAVLPFSEKEGFRFDIFKRANGPGKLCRFLKLNRSFYGEDICNSSRIWIEDRGIIIPPEFIKRGPRIGIDYAGKVWANKPWRFYLDPSDLERTLTPLRR